MSALRAIGGREYDYLELSNAWATVSITREGKRYLLDGDTRPHEPSNYGTLSAAIAEAWRALASYANGRAD